MIDKIIVIVMDQQCVGVIEIGDKLVMTILPIAIRHISELLKLDY